MSTWEDLNSSNSDYEEETSIGLMADVAYYFMSKDLDIWGGFYWYW